MAQADNGALFQCQMSQQACGVTGCGVVAFLTEETKMQCTIGCVFWPDAHPEPHGNQRGLGSSVILKPASETKTKMKVELGIFCISVKM